MIAEAPRFPKLARMIHQQGAASAQATLAKFLGRAMEAGDLATGDPQFAAELLMSMLAGFERVRLLYGVKTDPTSLSEAEKQIAIVNCFLRGFACYP